MTNHTPDKITAPPTNPDALLRLKQVLELVPVGRSSWWAGVKTGRYPQPVKLGPSTTVWRAADVLDFIAGLGGDSRKEVSAP